MTHVEQYVIKVGDLLRNPGRIDTINFENFLLPAVQGLTDEGVSGKISLQGVTDGSVKVVIAELHACIDDQCDISGEPYQRQVKVKDFDARFSAQEEIGEDRVYDEVFPLDTSSETINIYDLLVQSIILQEPLVHIKPGNESLLDDFEDDENYEDSQL